MENNAIGLGRTKLRPKVVFSCAIEKKSKSLQAYIDFIVAGAPDLKEGFISIVQ